MDRFNINFYKGIAILGIVATHVGAGSLPGMLGLLGVNGARGVQLFFIISAYLSFVSYKRFLGLKHNDEPLCFCNILEWMKNKYLKCIPLYLIAITISLIVFGGGRAIG